MPDSIFNSNFGLIRAIMTGITTSRLVPGRRAGGQIQRRKWRLFRAAAPGVWAEAMVCARIAQRADEEGFGLRDAAVFENGVGNGARGLKNRWPTNRVAAFARASIGRPKTGALQPCAPGRRIRRQRGLTAHGRALERLPRSACVSQTAWLRKTAYSACHCRSSIREYSPEA